MLILCLSVAVIGCGRAATPSLPAATALLYEAPPGWDAWEPENLIGTEPLFFASGYRASSGPYDGATLQLQTMPAPRPFIPPESAQELQEFASAIQGQSSVRRWIELQSTHVDRHPGIRSVAETMTGTDYRWIIFSRDKIFLLTLSLDATTQPADSDLAGMIASSIQLK